VFPGGKIDPEDYRCVKEVCTGEELEISASIHAAVRETQEEAGVTIPVEALVLMSCWTTPAFGNRPRFRTWFFAAQMNDQPIVVDGKEMLEHRWFSIDEAVSQPCVREFGMLPPTYNTLLEIQPYHTVAEALAALRQQPLRVYNPKLLPMEGGFVSLYEGDAGYETADVSAPGARHRLIVDHNGYRRERS
jgi:ADP-ribose pyrophosphatase YjhB (NUDIX family)